MSAVTRPWFRVILSAGVLVVLSLVATRSWGQESSGNLPAEGKAEPNVAVDEFAAWDESAESTVTEGSFAPLEEMESGCRSSGCTVGADDCGSCAGRSSGTRFVVAVLLATALAGVLVRFRRGIRLRPLFLLVSLVVLGFGIGGCPCPIKGFHEAVLAVFGGVGHVLALGWFLALIPLTYLFGRVWCGWVCHLGALQEFLYRARIIPQPTGRTLVLLRWVRRVLVGTLVVQIVVTRRNVWEEHGPFQAVFNLMVPDTVLAWVLVAGLLVLSALIYRPFCRAACPVGLVLGWVSSLPGAARLCLGDGCASCKVCRKRCPNGAIGDDATPVMESCIACGECTEACPKNSLAWKHRRG